MDSSCWDLLRNLSWLLPEIKQHLSGITNDQEKWQGLLEYALILVFVAVAVVIILGLMGPEVGGVFSTSLCELDDIGDGLEGTGCGNPVSPVSSP